jgi:hypothetical protein
MGGLLWKHFDYETGKPDARRDRELVIGYTVAVATSPGSAHPPPSAVSFSLFLEATGSASVTAPISLASLFSIA